MIINEIRDAWQVFIETYRPIFEEMFEKFNELLKKTLE